MYIIPHLIFASVGDVSISKQYKLIILVLINRRLYLEKTTSIILLYINTLPSSLLIKHDIKERKRLFLFE